MPIAIKMPALSPTMEEGTLAKWLVKVGDQVSAGDIMAEIETDKATMEFEAVDEGVIAHIQVDEGTEGVAVGTVIATLAEEGEDAGDVQPMGDGAAAPAAAATPAPVEDAPAPKEAATPAPSPSPTPAPTPAAAPSGDRIIASPLARRIAEQKGIDLTGVKGSGPNGRIVKADVENAQPGTAKADKEAAAPATPTDALPVAKPEAADFGIPHEVEKLSSMRKTIARRLTESKQQVPHIYLTVDIRLDALLKLRSELNAALEPQGVKLSVNDLMIKALGKSLEAVPACNVQFAGDTMLKFTRADVSVAVSIPNGLITPIVTDAGAKSVSKISTEMKDLATRAKDGKLAPEEYQGGTASLSNMGMFGIKQFEAVINPPQGMIMAIGAGDKRPYVVDDSLQIASVMSATGSFDHRAIDGADGAQLMKAFKEMIEAPLGLVA
ncbi:pyruvate dehydrogenase complex dihydrolipoamide acetyltransferase [Aurantiacibacter gangjinensis]|uniref:Acetyltransferase component of pyruvate dehydrogenase complex n=1 Tax=Aurantiacibacter gangjinensis TaxID=502682 RepID=A0A0G9MQR6_9SPHN|nr:pyruvate dehydrogenase complex dihydrolipoamide acetyltransferase [Aurantiacibacter gangjinensis]APE28769.1 Dihydrolipoamide acetyltransferase component of pyruvate dehydrogenase complex [Aurantiacibacter gangjinensis]KLE32924.1 branched-chain alpha-keto acid dehydrogenase subunit E2 [Aurantiacibacter gangjinensis]